MFFAITIIIIIIAIYIMKWRRHRKYQPADGVLIYCLNTPILPTFDGKGVENEPILNTLVRGEGLNNIYIHAANITTTIDMSSVQQPVQTKGLPEPYFKYFNENGLNSAFIRHHLRQYKLIVLNRCEAGANILSNITIMKTIIKLLAPGGKLIVPAKLGEVVTDNTLDLKIKKYTIDGKPYAFNVITAAAS